MNTQRQAQSATIRVWRVMVRAVSTTRATLNVAAKATSAQANIRTTVEQHDQARLMQAEQRFVEALCEDSNLELDWLWLATQVVREHERRYCFERVLLINPRNGVAKAALTQLQPIPAHVRRQAGYV